jgi:excisionase family DNA binding protein
MTAYTGLEPVVSLREQEASMPSMFCDRCGCVTPLLTIKEASFAVSISLRTIYYWIAKGTLHVSKTAGGRTLICQASLIRPFRRR